MSKLPAEFVKAPATQPKTRAPRSRKASLISPEPVRDPRELSLHLTDDEYKALEAARKELHQAGAEVTLEQMIHRVFAEWMLRMHAAAQPAPAAETTDARDERVNERVIDRLRALVAEPLRTWRELATTVWRASNLRRR